MRPRKISPPSPFPRCLPFAVRFLPAVDVVIVHPTVTVHHRSCHHHGTMVTTGEVTRPTESLDWRAVQSKKQAQFRANRTHLSNGVRRADLVALELAEHTPRVLCVVQDPDVVGTGHATGQWQ